MAEKVGHFEKGKWVVDPPQSESGNTNDTSESSGDLFNERLNKATNKITTGFSDLIKIGRELVGSETGREHIDKSINKQMQNVATICRELNEKADDMIKQIRKRI